jgi:hypothetical protein
MILSGDKMIIPHFAIMEDLKGYASPRARITRILKSGGLIQLRRGLFTDDPATPAKCLAQAIYGPSYISFQAALAESGLIPERVYTITSACFRKNKDKFFRTPLGEFRYAYLPESVFPYGLRLAEEEGMGYLIASSEKALCDSVYKVPSANSKSRIQALLMEDWRMDREAILSLDREFISWIAPMYGRLSLLALRDWLSAESRQ